MIPNSFNHQRDVDTISTMLMDYGSPMISDVLADCEIDDSGDEFGDFTSGDWSILGAMATLQEQLDTGFDTNRPLTASDFMNPDDRVMLYNDDLILGSHWNQIEGDICPEEVLLEVEVISSWEESQDERVLINLDNSAAPPSPNSNSEYSDYGSDNGADHNTSEMDLSQNGTLDLSKTGSYPTEQSTALDFSNPYQHGVPNGTLDVGHTIDYGLNGARYMHSGGSLVFNRSGGMEQQGALLDLSKTGYYQMPRIKLEPGLGIDPSIQYKKPKVDYNHNEAYSSLPNVHPSLYSHNHENAFIPKKDELIEEYRESNHSDAHYSKDYSKDLDFQSQQCQNIPLTVTSPDDDVDSGTESVCSRDSDKSTNGSNPNSKKRPGRKKGQVSKVYHLWEFIKDVLADPKYCPNVIKWENEEEGIFRVVQSEIAASLWGQKKNNRTKMTYEKMSRSIRYSRKEGYFDDLPKDKGYPKKLCFKFGKKAHGWSSRYRK